MSSAQGQGQGGQQGGQPPVQASLQQQMGDLQRQLTASQNAQASLNNRLQTLQGQLTASQDAKAKVQERVEASVSSESNLRSKVGDLERQLTDSKDREASLEGQLKDSAMSISLLRSDVESLDERLAESRRAESKSQQLVEGLLSSEFALGSRVEELETQLTYGKAKTDELDGQVQQLTSLKSALQSEVQGLRDQLNSREATVNSNEKLIGDLLSTRSVLEEQVQELNDSIQRSNETVRFQVSGFARSPEEVNPEIVDKIKDLVASSKISTDGSQGIVPALIFAKGGPAGSSSPYLFWVASCYGTLAEILSNGQAVFNNRNISGDQAAQSCWIRDALDTLANRFMKPSTPTTQHTLVALLILQAVAYLHGLMPDYSPDQLMHGLRQYTEQSDDSFILRSFHQKVIDFLMQSQPITSWVPEADDGAHSLDHTNSDLTPDLRLTADQSGILMLNQETQDGVTTYVFTREDVEAWERWVFSGEILLKMKRSESSGAPWLLQSLRLAANETEAAEIWATRFLGSLEKLCWS